jgi:hypothetical protein
MHPTNPEALFQLEHEHRVKKTSRMHKPEPERDR